MLWNGAIHSLKKYKFRKKPIMEKKLITWSEKYSVGYDEIDNQHKRLVEMINELYDSFKQGDANAIIENILMEMIKYTDYHFKTEETYFAKYHYSDAITHISEHQSFVEQVSKFYDDYKDGSVMLSYDVMNFLRDWLINHIQGSDRKFGSEYQNQNIITL